MAGGIGGKMGMDTTKLPSWEPLSSVRSSLHCCPKEIINSILHPFTSNMSQFGRGITLYPYLCLLRHWLCSLFMQIQEWRSLLVWILLPQGTHFCGEKISFLENIVLSSPFIHTLLGDKISTTFLQGNVKVINYLRLPKKNHIMFTAFLKKSCTFHRYPSMSC